MTRGRYVSGDDINRVNREYREQAAHIAAQAERIAPLEAVAAAARAYFVEGGSVARMVAVIDALRALDGAQLPVMDPDRSPQNREAAGW